MDEEKSESSECETESESESSEEEESSSAIPPRKNKMEKKDVRESKKSKYL